MIKDLIKDPKTDADKAANQKIMDNLNDLRFLFDLRKGYLDGTSRKNPQASSEKKSLNAETISAARDKWQSIFSALPQSFQADWLTHTKKIYLERKYRSEGFDPRAVNLLSFMNDHRLLLPSEDGMITFSSKEAVIKEMKRLKKSPAEIEQMKRSFDTIIQVLGSNIVKQVDYSFGESGRRQVEEVDIEDFVRASKLLGNDMFIDLLTTTQSALGSLRVEGQGQRAKIKEIYGKATDLIETLDPKSNKEPVANPIDKLKELSKELEGLLAVAGEVGSEHEGVHSKDIDEALGMLSMIVPQINQKTGRFNVPKEAVLTDAEKLSGDEYGVHQALLEPLQSRLKKIYESELDAVDQLQQIVVKLENFGTYGREGLGLSKSDTMGMLENLSREWYATYKKVKGEGVKTLSELIEEVNEKGFFADAVKVIESVNAEINRAVILNNEHHPFNADGMKMAESLDRDSKIHEHHRSVIEIGREYGLLNKDGKLDEAFKKAVMQDPYKAINKNVREKIYATSNTRSQKKQNGRSLDSIMQ